MPFLEGHHPVGDHTDPFAGLGPPDETASFHPLAEVDRASVVLHLGDTEAEWFIVDVETHGLGVRHLDDRLTFAGETVGVLGVLDVPRLVDAVDEGPVLVRVPALRRIATHPEVAVRQREESL